MIGTVSWLGLKAGRSISHELDGWPDHGIAEPLRMKGGAYFEPDPAYYQSTSIKDFRAQDSEMEGVDSLHPRTRADMYTGRARWSEIAAVVDALEIPVIGNGDIGCGEDARRMRDETGCAAVMIARGSHGNPWIFAEARAALDGAPMPMEPGVDERFEVCLEHARNAIAFERNHARAIIDFRKHLGWYTKGLPDGRRLRTELFQATTLQDIEEMLERYRAERREPVGV
jgi:tRNA-dihydrouridine synthase